MYRVTALATILFLLLATAIGGFSAEKIDKAEVLNSMGNGFFSCIINCIKGDAQVHQNDNDYNDMRYYYLSDNDAETKLAISVVKNTLKPKVNWTYKLYPRFRIGNMAFIEVYESPTIFISDLNKQPYFVVVVLDTKPQMFHMPDKELFAKFMSAVRANPDLMTPHRRLSASLILAIGGVGEYVDEDGCKPSWTDEDGVLVISCHSKIRSDNGMVPPKSVVYTITVDENQNFILETVILTANI